MRLGRYWQLGEVLAGGARLLVECRCPALRRFQVLCVRGAGPRARCAGRTPRSCAGRSIAAISALSPVARGSTNSSRSSSPFPPCSTLLVRDRSRHGRANGRRTVPRLRLGRVYLLAHDPGMLADLPDPAEPVVL